MLVKEIMTPKEQLILITQMTPLREALTLMKKHRVRALVVDKEGRHGAYGLVTYKNLLQSIVAEDGDIDLLNIYDIANTPVISVSGELEMKYAAQMMVKNSIKRLLVIDNNEIEGILTMSDLINILMEIHDI